METKHTFIKGLLLVRPKVFTDDRGQFMESWNAEAFNDAVGKTVNFVQDNESISSNGVLRGLHFQTPPSAQGKLIRVSRGSILDVAVDLRSDSSTFGQHFSIKLDPVSLWQLWIPEGFAHGFLSLENDTHVQYKCTSVYDSTCERSLIWNDVDLAIDWGVKAPKLSEKDAIASKFSDFDSPF